MGENFISIPYYARYDKRLYNQSLIKPIQKRIVLISDTHITEERNSFFSMITYKRMVEDILKIKNIDYILHLGDLTQNGTLLDYEIAFDLMKPLRNQNFYLIPGNHDARNVGYLLFEEFFGSRYFQVLEDNLIILGVDSSIPDNNSGKLGKRTIEFSKSMFLENPNKLKIFCFHHQLIPIPYIGRERSAIFDGGDTLNMALESNIDIILNGHRHVTNIYSCSDGNKDLILFNCGTASCTKTRYRESYSYTILDVNEKIAKFTTKKFMEGTVNNHKRYFNHIFHNNNENGNKIIDLIHMGNTHFSESNFDEKIYDKSVEWINKLNPTLIIHTGNLNYSYKEHDYEISEEKIKLIKSPKLIIPGFKDLNKYGTKVFTTKIGPTDPVFESEYLTVKGINSFDYQISSGNIGRKTMTETISFFKKRARKVNIIALNHRLIPPLRIKFDDILTDSGMILKNFTDPKNNIDLILMGKNNLSFSVQIEDTILSYCGALSSLNQLEPKKHSFNLIEIYDNGLISIDECCIETGIKNRVGIFWTNRHLTK